MPAQLKRTDMIDVDGSQETSQEDMRQVYIWRDNYIHGAGPCALCLIVVIHAADGAGRSLSRSLKHGRSQSASERKRCNAGKRRPDAVHFETLVRVMLLSCRRRCASPAGLGPVSPLSSQRMLARIILCRYAIDADASGLILLLVKLRLWQYWPLLIWMRHKLGHNTCSEDVTPSQRLIVHLLNIGGIVVQGRTWRRIQKCVDVPHRAVG